MKRFLKAIGQMFIEIISGLYRGFISSAQIIANMLNIAIPYIMYFIGQMIFSKHNKISVGWELLIPIGILFIVYLLKQYSNKHGKGTTIPVPNKRFTYIDEDGEVSVLYDRIQELLLYMADLEDYLERKDLI